MSMCPVIHDVSFGDAEFRSSTLVDSLHKACVNHRAVERHECGLVKTVGKDDCPGEAMIQNAEYKKPEGHNQCPSDKFKQLSVSCVVDKVKKAVHDSGLCIALLETGSKHLENLCAIGFVVRDVSAPTAMSIGNGGHDSARIR